MKTNLLVTFIIGTRPEAIKLAPVINAFNSSGLFTSRIILTGQHRDMVSEVLEIFNIKENKNLNIMIPNQTLNYISSTVIKKLNDEFLEFKPAILFVQGDTTSALAGALAAFHLKIPIAHVEAGLRTDDLNEPFPEEANRRIISQIATIHFAPTKSAAENLIKSSITDKVYITGNTVIDALIEESKKNLIPSFLKNRRFDNKKIILTTFHRRENWGTNMREICNSILEILSLRKDAFFIIPMHKNNVVRNIIYEFLNNNRRIVLTEPLKYDDLIATMKLSYFILTDSGGIQEEAPTLGKPVLVLRNKTEREEAIKAGTAILVGTDKNKIVKESMKLFSNKIHFETMSNIANPYGDGQASKRIIEICEAFFKGKN